MAFVALNKETGERIDITCLDDPSRLNPNEWVCQLCRGAFIIKAIHSRFYRPHFAHRIACTNPYSHCSESLEHMEAKLHIVKQLQGKPEYEQAVIELEKPIPEVMRIADIYVEFPNGRKEAHEAQLAAITGYVIRQRTEDYQRAGIVAIWWLGGAARTEHNVKWCIDEQGGCYVLLFEEEIEGQQQLDEHLSRSTETREETS